MDIYLDNEDKLKTKITNGYINGIANYWNDRYIWMDGSTDRLMDGWINKKGWTNI